ncbi:MAG: glycosyltransferase family 2 protein [Clostridiales bacterium]|nr:glycosyltransferase family 2 protein [Clostridiales bacterium]
MHYNFKNTLIIIPAYNEQDRINQVVCEIKKYLHNATILVVNDSSSDETARNAKISGAQVISHPYNMGYSAALLTGLKYAKSLNFENAVLFDGDGQHIAQEVKSLFKKKESTKSDIVIGSRFINKQDYNHGVFKTFGTKLFSLLIRIFTGKKITDPTSGFQLLGENAIGLYSDMVNFPEYPDANLIIFLMKRGLNIAETPVKMRERSDGLSMHRGIWRPIKYMVLVLYSLLLAAFFTKSKK